MATARVLTTDATAEPITTTEAKLRHHIDIAVEDTLIARHIKTARRYAENYTRRSFIDTTWTEYFDNFPAVIRVERNPLSSVTSVKYYDIDGVQQTLVSGTDYQSDLVSEPARIAPEPGTSWPSVETGRLNPVAVAYVAGYGATSASVPSDIIDAIDLIVGHLFEHREQVSDTRKFMMPFAAEALLDRYRLLEVR